MTRVEILAEIGAHIDVAQLEAALVQGHTGADIVTCLFDRLRVEGVIERRVQREPAEGSEPKPLNAAGSADYRYFIRDDDLKLLDALWDTFNSAAGVAFFLQAFNGPQTAAAIAGILYAGFRVLRRAKQKGASLCDRNTQILTLLVHHGAGGLRVTDIEALMRWTDLIKPGDIDISLAELSKCPVGDGSLVAFVTEDSHGVWRSNGV